MIKIDSTKNYSKKYTENKNKAKNQGGLFGALGYLGGSAVAGVAGTAEGIIDLVLAIGGDITGNHDYAEWVFKDNTVGNWHASITEDYNPGAVMQFAGDVSHGLGQSSWFLLSAIPGAHWLGPVVFGTGMLGQGISGAAAQTGDVGVKEVAYGVVSAGVETGLETALGGTAKLAKSLGKQTFKSVGRTAVRKGLFKTIFTDAAGEFAEEFASEYIDTALQRGLQIDPNATTSLKDALYAGAVGFVSGSVSAGSGHVGNAMSNQRTGAKIIRNGNSQTLVNTATKVADKLASQDTKWEKAPGWAKALRGQIDAYNNLSADQKTGIQGQTILGEMQASLYFAETQATFDLVQKNIQNASEQKRATWAEYINRSISKENRNNKDYTAADIANNTDNVAWQLAIYRSLPLMFNIDAAVAEADAAQESEIADVIARSQGAESGASVGAEPVTVGAEQYSIERTKDMLWEDQLKNPRRNDTFVVEKNTPSYLTERGISDRPLAIPQSVVTKAKSGKDADHSISDNNIQKLQNGIENAIAVIDDNDRNSLLFITNLKENDKPIVVAFKKDATFDNDNVHEARTIHVREDVGYYLNNLNNAKILVRNNNEFNNLLRNADNLDRVQEKIELIDDSIPQPEKKVNPKAKENISEGATDEKGEISRPEAVTEKAEETGAEGEEKANGAEEGAAEAKNTPHQSAEQTASPRGEALEEVDPEKAKRDAERMIEWEKKNAPTAEELNTVRDYVKGFDSLPADRQLAIVRMIRSSKGVDADTVRGVANLMAITNKKGAVLAPDLEFRFAELADGVAKRGIKTEVGGKTVIVLNTNSTYKNTIRGSIAHELVHYLENRKGYSQLAAYAYRIAKNEKIQEIEDLYDKHYKRIYTDAEIKADPNASAEEIAARVEERMSSAEYQELVESEVTASIVGEALNSEKFLKRYANVSEDKGILKTALRFIKGIFNSTKDKDKNLSREAQNIADLFDRALASEVEGEKTSGEKYSVIQKNGVYYTPTDKEIIKTHPTINGVIINDAEYSKGHTLPDDEYKAYRKSQAEKAEKVVGTYTNKDTTYSDEYGLITAEFKTPAIRKGKSYGGTALYDILPYVPQIFENAVVINTKPDSESNTNIKGIVNLVGCAILNNKYVAVVKLNVKEYANDEAKIYDNRVIEIEELTVVDRVGHQEVKTASGSTSSAVSSKYIIAKFREFVNTSDKKSSDKEQYDLDPKAVLKKDTDIESTDTENGKTYTKKSLVGAIETVLSEFKIELFGTRMVTLSKSKITKLVDDHLYRQMNRKTDDSEKGSISTKLAVASMLDDYILYLRITDEDGNIRKLTDVYSKSEIDEIKQKLANYLTEEINNRGVRTVDAESKGEKLAKKEDDRQLKKRAERGGFTEKDTRDAVKRVTEYTDEQLSELFDSQSAKVSKVQKEEFARDLLMALTTKDGKKRIRQIVDRFASDYVDKVRITVDGKRTHLSSLYDDEGITALKKELAERMQKHLTASGKDSLYIDIINRLENAKREFSKDLLDAEKTFKYGNAIIAEAEKLKENVGYRKRAVNDSVIYMLEKEMAGIVDHRRQISLASVSGAINMWSDFYNKDNPLLNHGGTLTDTASDYFDIMRVKIDDFLASRKSREGYALNGKEMELLSQIIGSARSILINHDTRFLDGKRISVKKGIYSFIKDQEKYNVTRNKGGKSPENSFGKWLDQFGLTKIGQATNQGYLYKIIAPEAVIGNIEGYSHDGLLSKAYNAVQSGADKAAKLRAQLLSPFENFLDGRNADGQKDESLLWEDEKGRKHKYRDRLLNKAFEFQGEQITYGEAIYFYGITKRAQAEKSLNIEGVSVYGDKTGKFRTEFEDIDIDSVQAELESHFTDLDYKYIEMFEKLFNVDARRIKGEADNEFAGWTNLVSGYYIPLIKDAFTRDNSVSERPAIENLMIYYKERFQKHTTDNAKQLQIVNVQSVIESYVSGLASYVHLSQPMKTFDMLWNGTIWLDENGNMVDEEEVYKKRSSQDDGEKSHKYKRYSIRKTVNRDVWQGADKYFIDLFNDIQGKRNMSDFDRAVSKWTGRWASGVLGANIKVIFTQTTSLVAATKNISPKNIASALSILSNRKVFAEVAKRADEYSDIIFPRSFDSGATKSQGNIDKLEDFNKNWGKGIEITDRAVCILLYHAAEIQVERTRGFKIGSEENANAAKELADRTIHETQAMTSQTERSAWQRETNLIAKTVTMFSSDAVKQLSYLYNAASRLIAHHRRVQNGDTSYEEDIKADKKALRRALAVSLSTTAMLTAIAQLFKLLYHQEEEEPEDQAVDVLKDFTSNTLGILPLASEIYDKIFNDYDVSIMVLDMFNTVIDDGSTLVQNVFKTASGEYISTNQIVKPMYNIAKNVSTMMGIPLAPAMRTVTGLVRRISPGTAYEAHDSFLYNMSYTSDLKKAVENGDTTLAAHILETLYKNEINAMVTSTELEEVARLYGLGNTGVIPQKIGTTVNDVKLDAKQRKQFESIYGAASGEVDKLIRSTYYQELTDEQKARAIKNIYALYYNRAAAEVVGAEWSNAQAYSKLTTNYAALFASQTYKSGLSPYKTLTGKEVSVKDQFVKYVENLGLSDADKLVVLYANGYRDAKTKKKMLAYINSLSISEEEKTRIAERLGFAIENGKVVEKKEELDVRG